MRNDEGFGVGIVRVFFPVDEVFMFFVLLFVPGELPGQLDFGKVQLELVAV